MITPRQPLIGHRYQLLGKIGQGRMGLVFRAADRLTGQIVALKRVLLPGDTDTPTESTPGTDTDSEQIRLAITREFRTLATLRHPNIISVRDYGFDAQLHPYFTMDLVEGSLTLTEAARSLGFPDRLRLVVELFEALAYVHRRGVIHRDLKPANVLVDATGQLKLLDFGLALDAFDINDADNGLSGTVAWLAPERLRGQTASVASDLYAAGLMAYEVFSGRFPFNQRSPSLLLEGILTQMPDLDALPVELPLRLVIARLLSKDPDARYDNARSVVNAIGSATHQPIPIRTQEIRESFLQASAFVGRENELALLLGALNDAVEGRGSTWLIAGESGVGKSRLLEELRTYALVKGALVLRGQAVAEGGQPYHLWREIARRLALSSSLTDAEAAVLKPLIPNIAAMLDRPVPNAPVLGDASAEQRLVLTLITLLKRQQQPVVILLEDLHWSTTSLEPLRQMSSLAVGSPWMIVATYRNDEARDLMFRLPDMTPLRLPRLDARAVAELAGAMLGASARLPGVIDVLMRETEGNPLFMVEVVRALAEEAGTLENVRGLPEGKRVFAGGVEQVLRRRLARVPGWAQPHLKLAAVAGRWLDMDVLGAAGMDTDSGGWLSACADASVLEATDGVWRFAHDRLRETVLAELSPLEQSRLHRQIANAMEIVYADPTPFSEELSDHWYQAGNVAKSLHYTVLTAQRLVNQTASYETAQRFLERGLALSLRHSESIRYRAILLKLMGDNTERQGLYGQAVTYYQMCLDANRAYPDETLEVSVLNGLSRALWRQGQYDESEQNAQRALSIAQEFDLSDEIAASLNNLGTIRANLHDFAGALPYYLDSLTLYREGGNQHGEGVTLINLGVMMADQAEHAHACEYYLYSLMIYRAIGEPLGTANALVNMGVSQIALGRIDEARGSVHEAMRIAHLIGAMPVLLETVLATARLTFASGDSERAAALAGMVDAHRATDDDVKTNLLKPFIQELNAALGEAPFAKAFSGGATLDVLATIPALLRELETPT